MRRFSEELTPLRIELLLSKRKFAGQFFEFRPTRTSHARNSRRRFTPLLPRGGAVCIYPWPDPVGTLEPTVADRQMSYRTSGSSVVKMTAQTAEADGSYSDGRSEARLSFYYTTKATQKTRLLH